MTDAHSVAAPPLQALDQPLPEALTGRSQGWLGRYRRWPVYSAAWQRGRLRSWSLWLGLLLVLLAVSVWAVPPADRPWPGLAQMLMELTVPLLLGPWLAGQVRRQGWPPGREFAGLCAAVAATVALVVGFHLLGAEPVKQWVAARLGLLDAEGRRPPVALTIGINIGRLDGAPPAGGQRPAPETAAAAPLAATAGAPVQRPSPRDDPLVKAMNAAVRGLAAFLLAGGVGLWAWRREGEGLRALAREQALARAEAQRREAELRLSVLAAQVEPHFLFNTLAGVRSAIATDPLRASEMIDRLVAYLRASIPRLRGDGAADSTLGQQLEQVRAYLGLMAARMPRLQFEVQAPAELLAAHCPPLMLISLAENAVKHGVEPKMGAARLLVGARVDEGGRLEVSVADDGVGFGQATAGSGLGLTNIRERLAQLHGERAALGLKARPEGGVVATLSLPLELPAPMPAQITAPVPNPMPPSPRAA
jgi:signal transduction histidine kinase